MTERSEPIIVEQVFAVSKDRLWSAITDRDQMVQWFFDNIPEFKPEAGFSTEFTISVEDRNYHHLWTITEAIPGQKVVYD